MIRITCETKDHLSLDKIEDLQKGLKKRSSEDIKLIIKSIEKYGFSFPFFIWENDGHNYCLDGHGRRLALKEIEKGGEEIPELPVVYIDAKDEEEAKQKLLRLNSQYGKMSIDSVIEFSDGLDIDFNELMLPSGVLKLYSKIETEADDFVPQEEDILTKTIVGDIYELSSGGVTHRLICGDSTDNNITRIVMNGELANLLLTDPPYNVSYVGRTREMLKITNDDMPDNEFIEFLRNAFTTAAMNMKSGASFYIWHADSKGYEYRCACHDAGLKVRQCLIWNKDIMVMGRQDYQWKHEPCLYGWIDGESHTWYGDRKQTTVLDFNRPVSSKEHPTMKPVELFAYLIENSTKKGDIILDPFLGSGTSIIAAEKLGRTCYGVEIDPHYCDIIVSRFISWCRENGRSPTIYHNGILCEEWI